MPDESLEILVKMTSDTSGGKEVNKELDQTKAKITDGVDPALAAYTETTKKAAEGAEHMGISHRGLHRALAMIGPEAAHAGTELLTAFSSPQMMGVMAVAGAVKLLDMAMQSLIEKDTSNIGAVSLSGGMSDLVGVAKDAAVAIADFNRTLNEGASAEDNLSEAMARAIALAKEQSEATKKQDDAEKELALAQLEAAKAEGKISDKEYRSRKSDIEEGAEMRKLQREKEEREQVIKLHREEAGKQHKLAEEDAAKVPEAKSEADRTRLAADRNARQIKAGEANEKSYAQTNPEDMTPGLKEARERNKKLLEMYQGQQAGLQEAANAAKERFEKLASEAKTAQKKAEQLQGTVDTEEEINRVKTGSDEKALGTRRQARRTMADAKAREKEDQGIMRSPEAKGLKEAADAEAVKEAGGQLGIKQKAVLAQAHAILQAAHLPADASLHALAAVHGNTVALNAKIDAMAKQIQQFGKQIKSQAAPP